MIRDYLQEVAELGPRGTAFRVAWELRARLGWLNDGPAPSEPVTLRTERIPFSRPTEVQEAVGSRLRAEARADLARRADHAREGRIRCFGGWVGDFGNPIDWFVNPRTGARWPHDGPWSEALRGASPAHGDVKLTWEAGRFPQAYDFGRGATWGHDPERRFAKAFDQQVRDFAQQTPYGRGVHWASSQEVAIRLVAWLFGLATLVEGHDEAILLEPLVARAIQLGAAHTEQHIGYARHAVYNNHLLSEAMLLLMASTLLSDHDGTSRYAELATDILTEQSTRQFYADGGYIQQSHNYQRLALQIMVLAGRLAEAAQMTVPNAWRAAVGRSVDFLHAHQNPDDGRLPNYGFNDGALVLPLSTCDYADFRPTLQAASIFATEERLYPPGPWDEEAAWLLGADRLDNAGRRGRGRRSRSFAYSGHHVLRDEGAPNNFGAFRCGSLRDRFSQIDMLHLDVWWRGRNVLTDPGSYQYNGNDALNAHFVGTHSHNTVTVDDRDQMRLHRRFKVLYWTRAELLAWKEDGRASLCAGEHYGYKRREGGCVHRRAVLFVRPELWIVVDQVQGNGHHRVTAQWLGGDFPHRADDKGVHLDTPDGAFSIAIYDETCARLELDVLRGSDHPPRGWLSRRYGKRVAVPSIRASIDGSLPATLISVLGPDVSALRRTDSSYALRQGDRTVSFAIEDGVIGQWRVA